MKKFVLGTALLASSLFADVNSFTPYYGYINYDSNKEKSQKDTASLFGLSYTKGNLAYLLELGYSHFDATYKSDPTDPKSNLKQDNFTIAYSQYTKNYMSKVGYHFISTSDETLGDGHTFQYTLGAYKFNGYNKNTLGLESYYSLYVDGHDDNGTSKSINIFQFTPFVKIYRALSINSSNNLTLKLNYEIAMDYDDVDYLSYEIKDTFAYKSFFTTLNYYGGEMKTGVKDSGNTVYNSQDLLKTGYGIKLGYYLQPNAILSVGYSSNTYREDGASQDGTNNIVVTTLNYTF